MTPATTRRTKSVNSRIHHLAGVLSPSLLLPNTSTITTAAAAAKKSGGGGGSTDLLLVSPWSPSMVAQRDPSTPPWHTFGPETPIGASSSPVRLGDVVGGHVHPSLCATHTGAVLAVYNTDGGGAEVLYLCRSEDGGRSWSSPAPIPASASRSKRGVYPGSLSVLRSGRIVLQWAPYYETGEAEHDPSVLRLAEGIADSGAVYRVPEYCVSDDDGRTFTNVKQFPHHSLTNYNELRFPLVELEDGRWVLPFYDRTVAFDPAREQLSKFGDGRNHGMVPIIQTKTGALISGAPQAHSPIRTATCCWIRHGGCTGSVCNWLHWLRV